MSEIAIIGAGIGGLVAGIALVRAGIEVSIHERAAVFAEVGAGLSLSPNAVKGLVSLGLGGFLEASANEPLDQFVLHGETGEELLRFDRRDCRATYGAPYLQLHRADLLAELVRVLGEERCRLDQRFVALEQGADGVRLTFADDSDAHADAVIGADGLRSAMRDALFETRPPRFSGHVAWRALVPGDRLEGAVGERARSRANINHVGRGSNLVTYPVRGRELVNIVALTRADDWAEESWHATADPAQLEAHFAGWTPYVREMIAGIGEGELYRWGLFVREPLERWVEGRAALLGDAAHPMLPYMGQGASSAIEDGVILGRCFAQCADPAEALALYQATRIERAGFLQAQSNLGGDRLQALDPYTLRDQPPANEDALGIFRYDPASEPLGRPVGQTSG